jgi:lysophospholipase L1-like esterase
MTLWNRLFALASFYTGLPASPLPADPFDHSWIRKWAAVGDSYASGLGVGPRVDYSCSRYGGGYANLINDDERLGTNPNRTFQYVPCSGLKSTDILAKQVPLLKDNLDVITVSAGGNDVGLGDVLDACIFQWRHGNSIRCEKTLNRSQELIDTVLAPNTATLLDSLLTKLSPSGRVYYPGYAQFFGESESCNNLSWSVWPRMPPADRQNLTLERRIRMNSMVDQVNEKLRKVVEKAGSRVSFIDWDWTFTQAGGRFCEAPFEEPAPDRKDLLFFEWNTLDDGDDPNLLIRPGDPVPRDSFEGDIGKWMLESMQEHPDWQYGIEGDLPIDLSRVKADTIESQRKFKAQLGFDDYVFWFLPDSWKRVFHPRAIGHHIIASMVLHEMAVQRGKELGIHVPKYSYQKPDSRGKLEL